MYSCIRSRRSTTHPMTPKRTCPFLRVQCPYSRPFQSQSHSHQRMHSTARPARLRLASTRLWSTTRTAYSCHPPQFRAQSCPRLRTSPAPPSACLGPGLDIQARASTLPVPPALVPVHSAAKVAHVPSNATAHAYGSSASPRLGIWMG
ncbi:hypothetical protein BD779DRAFT_466324 [Infundibulicybe gibba]|nr:hypothetical protein BD779DRAFT_466324 [Infundibulicybe gibba]